MSVIVAIKENGKIYMGSDSKSTMGSTRITLRNPNNFKIWKVLDTKNCLMGAVGNKRDSNIISDTETTKFDIITESTDLIDDFSQRQ